MKRWSSITVVFVALLLAGQQAVPASGAKSSKTASNSAAKALHRADFRVEGASCVVCLRRVAKTLRESKGVLKADISIYRPYWGLIIYDANATTFGKLVSAIDKEHVKLKEVEDKQITEMPLIVIPKGMSGSDK